MKEENISVKSKKIFDCRPGLEERLEEIINSAALVADSSCTR